MKVHHDFHQTAWSRRTSGFPLKFYDVEGNVTREDYTTKSECQFDVPDGTVWAAWYYESNSGHPSVTIFDVTKGALDETDQKAQFPGQMEEDIQDWMAPVR